MVEKKSMLCPNCRRLISNDEPVCPYCGMARPGSFLRKGLAGLGALHRRDPVAVLLAVNVAFFILSLLIDPSGIGFSANPMGFLSPSDGSLYWLGATGTFPISNGRWWTLVSASFLHGGVLHIFFNMMALKQLAPFVIDAFGPYRFAILYLWTGMAGFFVSLLAGVPFTIGASASLCGMIGAILYYGKSRGGFYGQAIYRQAMGWVAILVLFGLFFSGLNNWAHGGGIVSGILIALAVGYHEKRAENWTHRAVGTATILLTAAVLVWAVLQAVYHLKLG